VIKQRGLDNITVEELVGEITPKGRGISKSHCILQTVSSERSSTNKTRASTTNTQVFSYADCCSKIKYKNYIIVLMFSQKV
jgi:hypothetical protein